MVASGLAATPAAGGTTAAAPAAPGLPGGCLTYPFQQTLGVAAVRRLTHAPADRLLEEIAALGIDVMRVPAAGTARPLNPLLAGLPLASPALLDRAGFEPSYEGQAIPRGSPCFELPRDTVLIRETAPTYTLLHEVLHLMIRPTDGQSL